MNKLLIKDMEMFLKEHTETYRFLEAAHLRYEAFNLLHRQNILNHWEKTRLSELLECPACQVQWFLKIKDFQNKINESE